MQVFFIVLALLFFACKDNKDEIENKKDYNNKKLQNVSSNKELTNNVIPVFSIKVLKTIPHDTLAFTQGLFFHDGYLYESTGQYEHSSLRKINPITGKIEKMVNIGAEYFAEGIALHNGKIFLLTWQNNTCFVFDSKTFRKEKELVYAGEGWGLTNYDQQFLVQSDGTNILKIIDPMDFSIQSSIAVFADIYPVSNLNELENIEGKIWANIWLKDSIAVIDKNSGKVDFFVDVSSLRNYLQPNSNVDVVNGIAYDNKTKKIFLTGKLWPYIFEIELIQKSVYN
ncbi:MAG: glutaminyl-peptide cyclotransferase [Ignavibacteria bacterium]|nr:glutaminyl-peptide cyclotransferase [Ignavibacteria bacterium]